MWPLAVLLVFLSAAVMYGLNLDSRAQVGRPAPDFLLEDVTGRPVSLADFRGRPVIVNFWATWCPYCRHETPAHQAFLDRFGDRVAYVAVNLREPADKVIRHREGFAAMGVPLTGRVDLLDRSGRVFSLYRSTGTPETWIIDGSGRAVRHFIGPTTFEDLVRALEDAGVRVWEPPAVGWARAAAAEPGSGHRFWIGTDRGIVEADGMPWQHHASLKPLPVPVEDVRSLSAGPDGGELWVVGRLTEGPLGQEPARAAGSRDGGAAGSGGVWSLLRWDGRGWQRHLAEAEPLAVAAAEGGRVYAWTRDRGFVRSDDGGQTWHRVEAPFQPEFAGVALAVDPRDRDHLLSAGPGGVWRSRDGGRTWERTGIEGYVAAIAFDPRRPGRVYFADREGLLLSEDGGRTARRWMGSPQRELVAVAAGGWEGGPVTVAANGDVYAPPAGGSEGPWRLWGAYLDGARPAG